jgi:hypothetical protein
MAAALVPTIIDHRVVVEICPMSSAPPERRPRLPPEFTPQPPSGGGATRGSPQRVDHDCTGSEMAAPVYGDTHRIRSASGTVLVRVDGAKLQNFRTMIIAASDWRNWKLSIVSSGDATGLDQADCILFPR